MPAEIEAFLAASPDCTPLFEAAAEDDLVRQQRGSGELPPARRVEVPGYEILGELGRGGMGVVYQARHLKLNRIVALKMILSGTHADSEEMARFQTEAEAIARLQHPGIVAVHEVGEHDGRPYLSLDFCPGGSLEKRLAGTPLEANAAAALVRRLAEAMQAAHEAQVVRRDLKPANVLLMSDGPPRITEGRPVKRPRPASGRSGGW